MSLDSPYFVDGGYTTWHSWRAKEEETVFPGHSKIRQVVLVGEYDGESEERLHTRVSVSFVCSPDEKEIPSRIDEIVQILLEWKTALVEPNLTGDEPRISKNWRLPHESDSRSNGGAGTLGDA